MPDDPAASTATVTEPGLIAEDIYATGDVALAFNASAGRHLEVEHWQDTVDEGHVAGAAAARHDSKWKGVPGFWTTIGEATVKYHAWGDGYDDCRADDHADGFTVWFEADGATVGVLTHNADDDDLGAALIQRRAPAPMR